ncbi:MAG: glycosyltransferase family 4 protein [Thermoleophilia bacterium]
MVEQLAEHLAALGHEVAVAAGYPNHPGGTLYPGELKKLIARVDTERVRVVRVWHPTPSGRSFAVRAMAMASQAVSTALAGASTGRADVVVNFGPPLLGPLLAAGLARLGGAKLVSVVYDLYPDVVIQAGILRNRPGIGGARLVEKASYGVASRVVVLAEGFRRTLVSRGVPDSKIDVIPVWLDSNEIAPGRRDNHWRRQQGIPLDKFVVLYSGTLGSVSGAMVLAEVAALLREDARILFLVVGSGSMKGELEQEVRRRKLGNVTVLPLQPRDRLSEVQATSDVSMVTLAPGRGMASVPSKVVGYMAAGRAVIASVDAASDTGRAVRRAAMGLVVPPGDAQAIRRAILCLLNDPPSLAAMGMAARRAFEREHSGERVLKRYRNVIESR